MFGRPLFQGLLYCHSIMGVYIVANEKNVTIAKVEDGIQQNMRSLSFFVMARTMDSMESASMVMIEDWGN